MSVKLKLKTLKHQGILFKYFWKKERNVADLLSEAFRGVAARWTGEYDPIFTYITMFDFLKQNNITGIGLEIGGGYSTILLAEYADKEKLIIRSIDINPEKYLRILPSSRSREFLFSKINRIDKLSVSFDEVLKAYNETLASRIQEIGVDKFCENLKNFTSDAVYQECVERVKSDQLGKFILGLPELASEKKFYASNNLEAGKGYCSEIKDIDEQYAFIFFDCGEYSSLAEWFILEDKVEFGGFVFLHDIYYPKSIKNFIVAALISSSKKWEIVYIDKYTRQGGLVARRVIDV